MAEYLDKQDIVDKIWTEFERGGPYSHNIITCSLQSLANLDKELADKVYNELLQEGF